MQPSLETFLPQNKCTHSPTLADIPTNWQSGAGETGILLEVRSMERASGQSCCTYFQTEATPCVEMPLYLEADHFQTHETCQFIKKTSS